MSHSFQSLRKPALAFCAAALVTSCDRAGEPTASTLPPVVEKSAAAAAPAPAGLVAVAHDEEDHLLWPYSGEDFAGVPNDPINLIFAGHADPRNIRAALMALDGNRTGHFAGFDCTWQDAVGADQTGYSEGNGWTGSVIQLECGDYLTVRAHLRLFPIGSWTLANAHFDLLIPGTQAHEVIAWESAEQFVSADIGRTGLVTASDAIGPINQWPFFRAIRGEIATMMPPALKVLNPVPPVPAGSPVPLFNNGLATLLHLGAERARVTGPIRYSLTIPFNQVIPKPFCNSGNDFVLVQGVVESRQHVSESASGNFSRYTHSTGTLMVTPFDPVAGHPIGEPMRAEVDQRFDASHGTPGASVTNRSNLRIIPTGGPGQMETRELRVGPHGATRLQYSERCG
jgi:hypothetical protein